MKMIMMSPQVQVAALSTGSLNQAALRYHLPVSAHRSSTIPPSVSLANAGGASFNAWVLNFDDSSLFLSFTLSIYLGMMINLCKYFAFEIFFAAFFVSELLSIKILI